MSELRRLRYVCDCGLVEDPAGDLINYSDYKELSEYADSLVEFSKIPCLPKDLENLRNANASFAQENSLLQARIRELEAEVRRLKGWGASPTWILQSSADSRCDNTWSNGESGILCKSCETFH